MRILHVLGGLNRGGAETWLVQTLRHIDRSRFQFDFLVHTERPCSYDDDVRSLGARIMPCPAPSDPIRYGRNFLRILWENGPYDCVHSHVHRFSGYVLTLARLAGVPVRIAHSHLADEGADGRKLYRLVMASLLRVGATAGLAVSEKAATSLFGVDWSEDPRWQICHLGIELERFSAPVDSCKTRAQLGIPERAIVVGHVGRFFPQKNHTFLLDIAAQVCARNPDVIFLLVGDGPLRIDIEAKAESLGIARHIKFVGVRDDIMQLMTGVMDIFVLPSLYEGFPLVLLEAQAAGLLCFVADTVSEETVISPRLVKRLPLTDSASLWAAALLGTLPPPAKQSPPDAVREFSITAAVTRLCSVYEQQQQQQQRKFNATGAPCEA